MIIGIDPGVDGALAVLDDRGKFIRVTDTPVEKVKKGKKNSKQYIPRGMIELLRSSFKWPDVNIFIEKQWSHPHQGVASVFQTGYGYGLWEMAMTASFTEDRIHIVSPQRWKAVMGLEERDVEIPDKNKSLDLARKLWPKAPLSRVMDHNRAEALLLAEYGRRFLAQG